MTNLNTTQKPTRGALPRESAILIPCQLFESVELKYIKY